MPTVPPILPQSFDRRLSLDAKDGAGNTPMHAAADCEEVGCIQKMLATDAGKDAPSALELSAGSMRLDRDLLMISS